MTKKQLNPPEQTAKGHTTEVLQAGVSSIPLVGGVVSGVLNAVFPSELEKRRAIWEAEVSKALNELDLESLINDEAFLSILIQATEACLLYTSPSPRDRG